ncbi:MAG: adenylate/guanylate cyclase domain-containing protein [Gammaproteobacteria bacterium]|jgi:adenylate cyclase
MSEENFEATIMFVDVVDSTSLYETLGDQDAQAVIAKCLRMAETNIRMSRGETIKVSGDEVMALFTSEEAAVRAALKNLDTIPQADMGHGVHVELHTGLYHGPVIRAEGDVYGDAVNVAARLTSMSQPGQILTTRQTAESLRADLRERTRKLYDTTVKGREQPLEVYEVLGVSEGDPTGILAPETDYMAARQVLKLRCGEKLIEIPPFRKEFILGRDESCDLIPRDTTFVSRKHARIAYRRDKFVLQDHSTNGTYIKSQDGNVVHLHQEALPLTGRGKISLGKIITPNDKLLIEFSVEERKI